MDNLYEQLFSENKGLRSNLETYKTIAHNYKENLEQEYERNSLLKKRIISRINDIHALADDTTVQSYLEALIDIINDNTYETEINK